MTVMLWTLVEVTAALSLSLSGVTATVNPGFRTIVTQKGLDYVNQVGVPVLKEILQDLTIPDISGTTKVKALASITIDYTVSNIFLKSLDFGDHSLTSGADGLTADVTGVSLALSADWSYEEEAWPHLKDHGTVDISASGIELSISVNVTANRTDGHMQLNTTACSFSIGSLSVVFHGGASWLYNLFQNTIEDILRKELTKQVCTLAINKTNTVGNKEAGSLNVTVQIDEKIEISYALVYDPTFKPSSIVTDHKGEFLLTADPQMNPPFLPPPLPPVEKFNSSKMLYALLSTYVADSASYAYWRAGYMMYNISKELPPFFQKTTAYCHLPGLQELCDKFPDMDVILSVNASTYPTLNITSNYAVVTAEGLVSMFVTNGSCTELAFSLLMRVQADGKPLIRSNGTHIYIGGNVSNPRLNISVAKTNIGPFNISSYQSLIHSFVESFGLSYLNKYVNAGFPLPMVDGISLANTTISLGEGYILVGSDVIYSRDYLQKPRPSGNTLKSKPTPSSSNPPPPPPPPPHQLKDYPPRVEI